MPERSSSFPRIDLLIILFSIIILIGSVWVWSAASSISREVVFIATTIVLIIALVLAVNIAVLVLVRLQHRISALESAINEIPEGPASERIIVVTLTNTERRIINRLEENGGTLAQDNLRRITGLSKSTLSVALAALERKSLIRRETYGKTKLVTLNSNITR